MKIRLLDSRVKRYAVAAGIMLVGAYAVFAENGFLDVYRFNAELQGISAFNRAIEKENALLEEEIRLLNTDKRYVGHIARKELGMIGKDEAVYRIEGPGETPGHPAVR